MNDRFSDYSGNDSHIQSYVFLNVIHSSVWINCKSEHNLHSCFSLTMGQLYEKEKDEDGFLYVAYSGENTFGY